MIDLVYQAVWLPFGYYRGSILNRKLLADLRRAIFLLGFSDAVSAILVVLFLGIAGSSIPQTLSTRLDGHVWLTWLIIGAPCAWIGGQVIPASAVAKIFGSPPDGGQPQGLVQAVVEQPGTMRKAALAEARVAFETQARAIRGAEWEAYRVRYLALAASDPRSIARLTLNAGADLDPGDRAGRELRTRLASLRTLVQDELVSGETIVQGLKAVVDAAEVLNEISIVKAAVRAVEVSIAV